MIFFPDPAGLHGLRPAVVRALTGLVVAAVLGTAGCAPKQKTEAASAGTEATIPEGQHRLIGTIVSANAERGTLLVQHEDIPGLMPAMTMEFKASAGDVANARPGQRIRGRVYQAEDGYHLEGIWPDDEKSGDTVSQAARSLRQDTVARGTGVYREVGENLPDFTLYDQDGDVVQAARFRGRQIVLNFIYTRCPDPNMCPAATARMVGLQKLARDAGVSNLELVSITLDPEFDTPGVLHDYAKDRGIDTSNFSFLTGPEGAIKDLLTQLGVQSFQNGPLVSHTLATVLINETGKIVYRVDGSHWEASDFVTRMQRTPAAAAGKSDT